MIGMSSCRHGRARRWGWRRAAIPLALVALLAGCGTPQEVKDLSAAQIRYFDAAVEAVKIESEALVLAANTIKAQAEERIDRLRDDQLAEYQKLGRSGFSNDTTAAKLVTEIAALEQSTAESKANLAADLEAIRLKAQELTTYVEKMKQVQVVLDVYLQSEKVGESVSSSLLGRDSVQNALGTVNALLPRVAQTASELKVLIGNLGADRG
jgi:hypothetical protein